MVVLADEEIRRAVNAGEIQGFVKIAFAGRSVAEESGDHRRIFLVFGGHRQSHRVQYLSGTGHAEGKGAEAPRQAIAFLAPHEEQEERRSLDAPGKKEPLLPEGGRGPIAGFQRRRDRDRDRFLAGGRRVGAHPPLPLHRDGASIELAGQEHVLKNPFEPRRRDHGLELGIGAAFGIEDRKPFDGKIFQNDSGHRRPLSRILRSGV